VVATASQKDELAGNSNNNFQHVFTYDTLEKKTETATETETERDIEREVERKKQRGSQIERAENGEKERGSE